MECLRLLKRWFHRLYSKDSSLVESLPNEILQHIATFLPLPSAAAFALCSHRIYFALGTGSWEKLARTPQQRERERKYNDPTSLGSWEDFRDPPPQGEREELLSLLDRDLPKLIFCCQCALLHPADLRYDEQRLCSRSQWRMSIWHELEFPRVQMAMKRYRLGLSYLRQLNWFSTNSTRWWLGGCHATQEIVEARIAHEKFLVRVQLWMVLPVNEPELLRQASKRAHTCRHMSNVITSRGGLPEILECRMSHWREQDRKCPTCSGLKQCPRCETEFQIDVRELGPQGIAIAITKWWDLGHGISPYDPEYTRHCSSERYYCHEDPLVEFKAGSIQGAFENHQEFSIDWVFEANRWLFKYYLLASS